MGKYLQKRNTFDDFVDVGRDLVSRGIARPDGLSCEGRSAGGLLVGNVVNLAPDLFCAAVAGVPFVDLMTTMCDPSIPLTTEEWEEWGNPNEAKYYEYMRSYSPIDNAQPGAQYPSMLIVSGLNDPRVAYWEPTKWAQVLRATVANGDDVLLKMDLAAGHFSASDRYRYLRELAFDYAWLLDKLGKAPPSGSD
jgi:oligopeptidase B